MGFLFWFVLRAMIMGVIGNSFYKWFATTKTGKWFDAKIEKLLNKVTNKHDETLAKSKQLEMFVEEEKLQKAPVRRLDGGPAK